MAASEGTTDCSPSRISVCRPFATGILRSLRCLSHNAETRMKREFPPFCLGERGVPTSGSLVRTLVSLPLPQSTVEAIL